jgi:hypothetical protein
MKIGFVLANGRTIALASFWGKSEMAKKPKELPIPPDAVKDSTSIEMIRVWIANEKLQTSLNIGVWGKQGVGEEKAWGMMLADVIQHVANAIHQSEGTAPEETIRMIKRQLDDELEEPTSEHPGGFV